MENKRLNGLTTDAHLEEKYETDLLIHNRLHIKRFLFLQK